MRPVLLAEATSDLVVAKPIHNADGSVLLRDGAVLSYTYRQRLLELGITQVYVRDPLADGIEIEDVVSEATRARLTRAVAEILFRILAGGSVKDLQRLHFEPLREVIREAIDDVRERNVRVYSHIGIRPVDDYSNYTAFHCASCALLAIAVGARLGYRPHQLEDLGLAEAVHDLGKARINQRLLYKPGRLDPHEFEEIKRHPGLGNELLRNRDDIPPRVAQAALNHHEKLSGKGYPNGKAAGDLSEFDRLAAIVDVFDALASERIYKPRKSFDDTLSILEKETAGGFFDPELLKEFKTVVPRHPVGSIVVLSTGEIAIVAGYGDADVRRPIVRPLYRADGAPMTRRVEIALGRDDLPISIVRECAPGAKPGVVENPRH